MLLEKIAFFIILIAIGFVSAMILSIVVETRLERLAEKERKEYREMLQRKW